MADERDDYGADAGSAGSLGLSGTIAGVVGEPDDHDWHRVTLAGGTWYRLTAGMAETNGVYQPGGPSLRLVDEYGNEPGYGEYHSGGWGPNERFVRVREGGTYYVDVSSGSSDRGAYTLSLDGVRDAVGDTPGAAKRIAADPQEVPNGLYTAGWGVLDRPGDVDVYVFDVKKGMGYGVLAAPADNDTNLGYFTPRHTTAVVTDARGNEIARAEDWSTSFFTASATGVAYVTVTGSGAVTTGPHYLGVHGYPVGAPDTGGTFATAKALDLSGDHAAASETLAEGDDDMYRFTLKAAAAVRIAVDGGPAGLDLYLYDRPEWKSSVADTEDRAAKRLDLDRLGPGTYYLGLHAPRGVAADYRLAIDADRVAPPPRDDFGEVGDRQPGPGALKPGASVTGAVQFRGDEDAFRLALAAGETYVIEARGAASGTGRLGDPEVTLHDGAGRVIAYADNGGVGTDARLVHAARGGEVFATVGERGRDGFGSYTLSLTEAAPAPRPPAPPPAPEPNPAPTPPDPTPPPAGPEPAGPGAIRGKAGADDLIGTAGADLILALDGDDRVRAGGGGDRAEGGGGRDALSGEAGNDALRGGLGGDTLLGNDGDDLLLGQDGDDVLKGGAGRDRLSGGGGNDFFSGGWNGDVLEGGSGADRFATHWSYGTTRPTGGGATGADRVLDFGSGDRAVVDGGFASHGRVAGAVTLAEIAAGTTVLFDRDGDGARHRPQVMFRLDGVDAADLVVADVGGSAVVRFD